MKFVNISKRRSINRQFLEIKVKLSEAPSEGLAIFDYDNNSEGARAYRDFAKEVCKR